MPLRENGKLQDVLIEDTVIGLTVWADPGMKDIISSIPGIAWCGNINDVEYCVFLDPRYDIRWVKQEIIARIKIGDNHGKEEI